jgi:hypothetical protein
MYLLYLVPFYLKWHYTEGFRDLSCNWKSFISFTLHFFSIGLLFRTWLAPFGRLNEEYQKGFDAEAFFETLVVNTLMRIVGFVLRTCVIFIGLLVLFLVIIFGPIVFVLWVLAPFIIMTLFTFGIVNLVL